MFQLVIKNDDQLDIIQMRENYFKEHQKIKSVAYLRKCKEGLTSVVKKRKYWLPSYSEKLHYE
jgi:hypothetical protein